MDVNAIVGALPYAVRLAVALVLPPVLGWLLTRVIAGRGLALSRLEQAALSWGLGWGLITLEMLALGQAGLTRPWRPLPLFATWLVTALALAALHAWLRARTRTAGRAPHLHVVRDGDAGPAAQAARRGYGGLLRVAGLALLAVQSLVVVLHAVALPVNGEDAWSIWAFKARIFFLSQGIPPAYFHDASKLFSHPDYPLMVPLAETWVYGWLGRADDWAAMILFPPFFLAILAVVAGALGRAYGGGARLAGAALLACVPFLVIWGSMGDADVPLTLAAAGSAVFLWRWLRGDGGWRALAFCGALSGLAAWTKKEGLILLGLTALVVALAAWRRARGGGPAEGRAARAGVMAFLVSGLAMAGPWLAFAAMRHPLTRDFLPFTVATLLAHLDRLPTIAAYVGLRALDISRWNAAWVLVLAAVVLGQRTLRRSRPLAYLLLLLVMEVGSDGGIFIFSDWQPFTYHMATALDRLLLHALPLAVLVVVGLIAETRAATAQEASQVDAAA